MKSTTATTARARLVDGFGRTIDYVRLSVTDRCNLRCFYCLPRGVRRLSEPDHWLRFGEIERLMRAFAALGVQRLRLTGGEPLVRARLPELAARLSALPGIADVSLSTNATLLADYAEPLRRAGVMRLNVSLDSLKPERFREITGGRLEPVLDGLRAARRAGFDWIKINMLALKGVNDDEFTDMVEFCAAQGFTLRFIEVMPVGRPGVEASRHYLDLRAVKARLAERFDLIPGVVPGGGPARYVRVRGTDLHIGFITPMSRHFCDTCNRVRLSVDGTLHLCLGQDHSVALRPLLRAAVSDEDLQAAIRAAVRAKPARHEFRERPGQVVRFMAMTGG